MKTSMKINIRQRVNNLKLGEGDLWFPLFEAVVNSIQAIQEKKDDKPGNITIKIIRRDNIFPEKIGVIDTIEVSDDGIGFDDMHFEAFSTSDTDYKVKIGGKGIGRFSWLKFFHRANVKSFYYESGVLKERNFNFKTDGIYNHSVKTTNKKESTGTTIRLINMMELCALNSEITLELIANELMTHISLYLINNEKINIDLIESSTGQKINLNEAFFRKLIVKHDPISITIDRETFVLNHVFSSDKLEKKKNIIYFCAQSRVVQSVELDKHIELPETYLIDGKELYYNCYLTSKYLDSDVSGERLAFNNFVYEKKKSAELVGINGYDRINYMINIYLEEFIKQVREKKEELINVFITTEKPEFGYFFHNDVTRERLSSISYSIANDKRKLYSALREIDCDLYDDTRKKVENNEVTKEQIGKIVNAIENTAKTSLAEYIIRRKLLIELLESKLGTTNEVYERESTIHNILFPMREKMDTIDYNSHNLWLVDERLSYSFNCFSDIELKKIANIELDDRPDLLLINSFTNIDKKDITVIDSITIVEIKRPGRNNFSENNPTDQIIKYIMGLKNAGTIKGYDGRLYELSDNAVFMCYLIGDLTNNMKNALKFSDFTSIDNGNKYFKYQISLKAYFEFISYNRLVGDAKSRNKIFIDKLLLNKSKN